MSFGALIHKHRRLKGLTLKQISAPLGVSAAYRRRGPAAR